MLVFLFLILVFIGCKGEDGEDGTSYLALDAVYYPIGVNFPQLPASGHYGTYYEHPPGTYWGEYIAWDYSYYSVYYTIEVNEGEEGKPFGKDGDDGADRYYTMWLYSWGAELYYFDDEKSISSNLQKEQQKALALGLNPSIGSGAIKNIEFDISRYDLDNPEIMVTVKIIGDRKITIESKRYRLK